MNSPGKYRKAWEWLVFAWATSTTLTPTCPRCLKSEFENHAWLASRPLSSSFFFFLLALLSDPALGDVKEWTNRSPFPRRPRLIRSHYITLVLWSWDETWDLAAVCAQPYVLIMWFGADPMTPCCHHDEPERGEFPLLRSQACEAPWSQILAEEHGPSLHTDIFKLQTRGRDPLWRRWQASQPHGEAAAKESQRRLSDRIVNRVTIAWLDRRTTSFNLGFLSIHKIFCLYRVLVLLVIVLCFPWTALTHLWPRSCMCSVQDLRYWKNSESM